MKTKWLLFVLLAITGLMVPAQELKRGDFMSRNEQQQQAYQKERIQLKIALIVPTLRKQLEKKDYRSIKTAADEKITDDNAEIRHLGKMEAIIAGVFLEPDQAETNLKQLLNSKTAPDLPDWIYLVQNLADLMPRSIVQLTVDALKTSGPSNYQDLAEICYRNGETKRALAYLDQYISWIKESILDQTAHLNEAELLRETMVR